MHRRDALRILGSSFAALPLVCGLKPVRGHAAEFPNIIFVMADDHRKDALSIYGNRILKTPNIDRIGNEGIRFDEAFVTNSLCGPSRASFLTGLYSHANGVISNASPHFENQAGLKPEQRTFVRHLHNAGYYTGVVGKWQVRTWPDDAFDHWVVFPGHGEYIDPDMVARGTRVKMRGHADDVVGDQALTFLDQRPRGRPFCLLLWFKSPHRAWRPSARYERAFDDIDIPLPRTFEDKFEGRPDALRKATMAIADMPDFRDRGVSPDLPVEERKRLNLQMLVKNYYRVLLSIDDNVGRLLEYLDANSLSHNTLVIYSSDNGFFLGEHGLYDKRLMYEPSIRVPFLARWPARIPAGRIDRDHMVLNVDLAPTLLNAADIPMPSNWHGRSMLPLMTGGATSWRNAFLYEYFEYPAQHCVRKNRGVRTKQWKLIHFWEQPQEWELYDLQNDPDELCNLAGSQDHATVLSMMKERLQRVRDEVGDRDPPGPVPIAQPCYD
jgi:arylsulfatase A-like enzyme